MSNIVDLGVWRLSSIWHLLAFMCIFHFSFSSSLSPRYFNHFLTGIGVLWRFTGGQVSRRVVKVTCGLSWIYFDSPLLQPGEYKTRNRRVTKIDPPTIASEYHRTLANPTPNSQTTLPNIIRTRCTKLGHNSFVQDGTHKRCSKLRKGQ